MTTVFSDAPGHCQCGQPTTAYDGVCLSCRFPNKCTGCGQRLLLNRPGRTLCARCDTTTLALRPSDYAKDSQ